MSVIPPKAAVKADIFVRPVRARGGCEQAQQKQSRYSITSSARASSVGGTVKRHGGLEVGHELEPGRLYDRQISCLGTALRIFPAQMPA
jgi:hypothetical protein